MGALCPFPHTLVFILSILNRPLCERLLGSFFGP